jgi:hypothetical protein
VCVCVCMRVCMVGGACAFEHARMILDSIAHTKLCTHAHTHDEFIISMQRIRAHEFISIVHTKLCTHTRKHELRLP